MMGSTFDVRLMYEQYPYPSPLVGDSLIPDVSYLMSLLLPGDELSGSRILDAGCGTGHRLVALAKRYKQARFVGIDLTPTSLNVARRLAQKHGVKNVRFEQANLLELFLPEEFDFIISTGVVHCLETPNQGLKNLCALLAKDGTIMVWHYHALGEHRRLLDRELLFALWGKNRADLSEGLSVLKELGLALDISQYGSSSTQKREEVSQTSLDVDAYMHPIVNAYRFKEALEIFSGCGVSWTAINGINMPKISQLIDLDEVTIGDLAFLCVRADRLFTSNILIERYKRLDKLTKLAVIELCLKPTGFTVMAGKGDSYAKFGSRIKGNMVSTESMEMLG